MWPKTIGAAVSMLPLGYAGLGGGPARSEGEKSEPVREGNYSCTTTNLNETRQYDEIVAYAANSESLWPGALLCGDSLYTGAFTRVDQLRLR